MKKLQFLIIALCLSSCKYLETKKIDSEAILSQELKTFNWNEVDTYPTFAVCDSLNTKSSKKECFENTLGEFIFKFLANQSFTVSQNINDTVLLDILISETGKLQINHIKIDSITQQELPHLEESLKQSIDSLPKIYPAIKRNQPVKTEFKLPIIIEVN